MQKPWRQQFQNLNEPIAPSEALLQATRQQMVAARPQRWLPRLQKALAVAACASLIFIGAVNLSPVFASAAASVPIVRELVALVSFDPSLKAAIEHNYVQLVKRNDSDNGYRLEVEYLVADQANLTVFYRLMELDEEDMAYHYTVELVDQQGEKLEGYGATWGDPAQTGDALREAQFHFTGNTLPEQPQLLLTVKKELTADNAQQAEQEQQAGVEGLIAHYEAQRPDYETVATMTVPLRIDRDSLFNVRVIDLQQTVQVAGQRIVIEKAEIYPTQMRVYWQEAADNTAYITDLSFSLQGKRHHRWETISNGVSGIGAVGEPRQSWLDSTWFADDGQYLLQIDQIALLPKEHRQVTYDYGSNTFSGLPDYVRLEKTVPCDTGLFMQFEIKSSNAVVHGGVFGDSYLDGNGEKQEWNQMGSGRNYDESEEDEGAYYFYNQFIVKHYENGSITFTLNWAPPQKLEDPVQIPIEDGKVLPE